MAVLQQKYIRAADEKYLKAWIADHSLILMLGTVFAVTILLFFGVEIISYVQHHVGVFYSLLFILLFVALELVSMVRRQKVKVQ